MNQLTSTQRKILIIAELAHNFNGDISLAKRMIWSAKKNGADIVKFQAYDIDAIKKSWESHYQELKESQLSKSDLEFLERECKKADIEFACSAFDIQRVIWLEEIGVTRHKLASRSIYNAELIEAMEATGKPIIASLGNWEGDDIPKIKNAQFLFCIPRRDVLEGGVTEFPKTFVSYQGFSDHTIGLDYAKLAIDRGAKIIEKHFTFDKNAKGCDQAASMLPEELKELVQYGEGTR